MATVATATAMPFAICRWFRQTMNANMNGRKSRALPRVNAAQDSTTADNIHSSHVLRFHERTSSQKSRASQKLFRTSNNKNGV